MIVDIALGIVLGCFLLAVGVPLVLGALVGGVWLCVEVVGLCVRGATPACDLMVRLLFAPILIAQHTIRRHPVAVFLVLTGAGFLGAFLFVNQDTLW